MTKPSSCRELPSLPSTSDSGRSSGPRSDEDLPQAAVVAEWTVRTATETATGLLRGLEARLQHSAAVAAQVGGLPTWSKRTGEDP